MWILVTIIAGKETIAVEWSKDSHNYELKKN